MGTWISHIRIAECILQHKKELAEAAFLFGNIAPDSGVPNEDWSRFDPPKEITHFLGPGEDEGRIKDLEFFREYLARSDGSLDRTDLSFRLGYFVHLLCDNLWSRWIVSTAKREFQSLFEEQGVQAWWTMKEDWYGLDQKHVRDHPEGAFWRVLMKEENPAIQLPYLPDRALDRQYDYVRKVYSQPDEHWGDLDRIFPYLNERTMNRYVTDSTEVMLEILSKEDELKRLEDGPTALALIPTEQLQPYDPPLGDAVGGQTG